MTRKTGSYQNVPLPLPLRQDKADWPGFMQTCALCKSSLPVKQLVLVWEEVVCRVFASCHFPAESIFLSASLFNSTALINRIAS